MHPQILDKIDRALVHVQKRLARSPFGVDDVMGLKLDVIVFKLTQSLASCNAIVAPLTRQ
jgi:hypothetical protein